jgi:acetyl-CoA acetyltransferase
MPNPVICGVAQVRNKLHVDVESDGLLSVKELMQSAIEEAMGTHAVTFKNAALKLKVVATWTQPFHHANIAQEIIDGMGLNAQKGQVTGHGGNAPILAMDELCRDIANGECKVGIVCGGEALATLAMMSKRTEMPKVAESKAPTRRALGGNADDILKRHGCFLPIHCYPLLENARSHALGKSNQEMEKKAAELYQAFDEIAVKVKGSWNEGRKPLKLEDIQAWSISNPKNRMICYPYPLLQCAFNTVNLASAVVIADESWLLEMGIEGPFVYPMASVGASDCGSILHRSTYSSSPSMTHSIVQTLRLARLSKEQVDLWDIYSCFPFVPLAASDLIGKDAKHLSLLGGLTSFGGAGNNYSLHAVIELTRRLKARQGDSRHAEYGVILANGGNATYHHAMAFSSKPTAFVNKLADELVLPKPVVVDTLDAVVQVVTYTVAFGHKNDPIYGVVIVESSRKERTIANVVDPEGIATCLRGPIGLKGSLKVKGDKNIFKFV